MRAEMHIGEHRFAPELNELHTPDGRVLRLEPRTSALLGELAQHAGQVRSREELLAAVWGEAFVTEAALTHCIWELRRAFDDDARKPRVIQTVPRRGYRLLAAIRQPSEKILKTLWLAEAEPAAMGTRATDSPELVLERHRQMLAELLQQRQLEAARGVGSGTLVLFDTPAEALSLAIDYHGAVTELRAKLGLDLGAKVGIHLGEVSLRHGSASAAESTAQVEGEALTLMPQLLALARSQQTVLTRGAFDLARRANGELPQQEQLNWLAHGSYLFDGVDAPIEIFTVDDGRVAATTPASGRRADGDATIRGWRPAPGQPVPQRPHWQLLEKLGEGGFGEAWLTQHDKTGDRRVFKFCFEAERLRALQREVTLFRLLKETLGERDDIAHLLDWSFDEAPYFIESEHSSGGSLADWAKARGGLDAVPRPQLLELMAQAAEALAAAHSVGILHKDVKPGNILIHVDHQGRPRARLADFGIGRILQPQRLADAGITLLGITGEEAGQPSRSSGTQLYMAPELIEGRQPTVQADIYALGVVLYQVAIGELDRAVATGWQRNVQDELLAEDLAAMLDVAAEQRPSALQVADRLRRLEERRGSRQEQARQRRQLALDRQELERSKRRRRQWSVATGLAIVVLLLTSMLAYRAHHARRQAEAARQRAEELVTFMLGDLRRTLDSVGRLDAMDGTADKVLSYYASLKGVQLRDEELARHSLALRQLGEVRMEQGRLAEAEEVFSWAAELASDLSARDPRQGAWRASHADSLFWLGYVRRQRGELAAALEAFSAHQETYGELATSEPGNQPWQLEAAYGHGNVGTVLRQLGDLQAAAGHLERRQQIFEGLVDEQPQDAQLRLGLAASHHQLGQLREEQSKLSEAATHFRTEVDLAAQLVREQPADSNRRERLAVARGSLGWALWLMGRPEAARQRFAEEAQDFEQLTQFDQDNTLWRRNLAVARGKLARAVGATGDRQEALQLARQSEQAFAALVALDGEQADWQRHHAHSRLLVARQLANLGRTGEALRSTQQVLAMNEERLALGAEPALSPRSTAVAQVLHARLLHTELFRTDGARSAAETLPEQVAQAWQRATDTLRSAHDGSADLGLVDLRVRALIGSGAKEAARPMLAQLLAADYRNPELLAFLDEQGLTLE